MRPDVVYTPYATTSRKKTGYIITSTQFEQGDLFSEIYGDTEIGNKYDDDSTIPPLIIEEKIDAMSSVNESDSEPMSMNMLEDIRDGSQYHLIINRIEVRYKILDRIK